MSVHTFAGVLAHHADRFPDRPCRAQFGEDEVLELSWTIAEFIAADLARASFIAIRQAKKAVDEGAELGLDQGLVLEAEAWRVAFCAADGVEGLRAFVEG